MLAPSVPRSSVFPLLAALLVLNGTTVSTLYWAQSVAPLARASLGASYWVGLMPSATLAGYAVGVALLASIARDLTTANGIGLHALLLGTGLSAAAVAPTAPLVCIACFVIGMGCSLTQRVLGSATSAVAAGYRGHVIGCVIASGLLGIVLARAVVPTASLSLGWRTMFILDAALVCGIGLLAAIATLRVDRRQWEADHAPMPNVATLWRTEPVLRRAALQQACVFAAFNCGWAIFPRALAQHHVAGLVPMGVVAALGAVAALFAGWRCARIGPGPVARTGFTMVLVAVGGAVLWGSHWPLTAALMVLLDTGTQTALVANQARAQARATSPAMRGRLAAMVTTIGFGAGAAGAAIGNALL